MNAKRIFALLMALVMVFSLTACGAAPEKFEAETETAVQPKDTDMLEDNMLGQIGQGVEGEVEVNVSNVHMDSVEAFSSGQWESLFTPIDLEGRALDMANFDLTPTAEELEAMKKEPAYGKTFPYFMYSGCAAGITVAELLGYFDEIGLDTEMFKGASDVEAVGTGQVNAVITHIATLLVPITNGVDIALVGGAHQGCKSLYTLADSEYKSLEDLKGTQVAIPNGIGNSDYNITCMMLDAIGIDPKADLDLIQVTADACVAAMQKGEISAAILSDVYAYGMVKDGTLRCVGSMLDSAFTDLSMCCAIALNGEFLRENPVISKKFVQCVHKAHAWIRDNPEEATDLLLENSLNSGDREMNIMINNSLQFGVTDAHMEEQLRNIVECYLKLDLITSMEDADEVMDLVWNPVLD